jgi:hypothetical protein
MWYFVIVYDCVLTFTQGPFLLILNLKKERDELLAKYYVAARMEEI